MCSSDLPGDYHVGAGPQPRSPRSLGARQEDLDPLAQAEGGDRLAEEQAAAAHRIEQDPVRCREEGGEHQTGHAATAPQVDAPIQRTIADGRGEGLGMGPLSGNRTGAEESPLPRPLEHLVERVTHR